MSAVMPCFRALNFATALPSSDAGPVERWALRRFASICFWLAIFRDSFEMRKRPSAFDGAIGLSASSVRHGVQILVKDRLGSYGFG